MFVLDDILLFPVRGLTWLFREIENAAEQEVAGEAEDISNRLSTLYMMLDTGKITEEEFDLQEKELLDRLDQLREDDFSDD